MNFVIQMYNSISTAHFHMAHNGDICNLPSTNFAPQNSHKLEPWLFIIGVVLSFYFDQFHLTI